MLKPLGNKGVLLYQTPPDCTGWMIIFFEYQRKDEKMENIKTYDHVKLYSKIDNDRTYVVAEINRVKDNFLAALFPINGGVLVYSDIENLKIIEKEVK